MGRRLYLDADPFRHIPLAVASHITEVPAAVRNPHAPRIFRSHLPQINDPLLRQAAEAADLRAKPLFLLHTRKFSRDRQQIARYLLHV